MPKFAANLTFLFKEVAFLDRFKAAARAGFDGVEVLFPYDHAPSEIADRLHQSGMPMVLLNTPMINRDQGDCGYGAVPGKEEQFKDDFLRSLKLAKDLKAQHIHVMTGNADGADAKATFITNLKWAAAMAPEQSLTIEPLNQGDMPGYYLSDYPLAANVIAAVGAPNLGLQYDAYHSQLIHGDARKVWQEFSGISRHVQVGSVPGRREPIGSAVDFCALFEEIDACGYDGFVSAEYNPTGRTEDSLSWMKGTRS